MAGRLWETERDRAAALVEFSLILPLLAVLLFGIFSGGLVLDRRASVAQAAREGARYGATLPTLECFPVSNCAGRTWAEHVQATAADRSAGEIGPGDVCVALVEGAGAATTVLNGSGHYSTNGTSPCFDDGSADSSRRVQVRITTTDEIDAVFVQMPITLTGESISRFEQ